MRVAHLTATFPPYLGGAGTAAEHMARGLAERGHEVEVFTSAVEGAPGGQAPDVGRARVTRLKAVLSIGNAPLMPDIARIRGFDVVHLHHPFVFGTELLLLGRLRREAGSLVVSYHNRLIGDGLRKPMFWGWEQTWGRAMIRSSDTLCVLSRGHADSVPALRAVARRHPDRVAVVPNGVDVERFRPSPEGAVYRASLGIPADAVVAAFVATLDRAHYFKRLDLAIEALARTRTPVLHLLVVGGGELLDGYREQAAAAGVGERVHFTGAAEHDRLPGLLRSADLLALPSDPPESFGIVQIEAMATGLPTISTDLPGVSEVGRPGETGFLVPRGDAGALGQAMDSLAEMGAVGRAGMGEAGRALCLRSYAWESVVERLEAIYAATLARRAKLPARSTV